MQNQLSPNQPSPRSARPANQENAVRLALDLAAATGELTVTADRPLDDTAVIAAVAEAGYLATRA